jgi:hypothetical protein
VKHPPEEHHQVHPDAEEGARHKSIVHCIVRIQEEKRSIVSGTQNSIYSFVAV